MSRHGRCARTLRSDAHKGSGWYEALARVGLVAKGVSYGIVGVLAIGVAAGIGGEATSRQGALKQLAGSTFGAVVLVLLALGFAAYALWRFVQAAATSEGDEKKSGAKRAGYVGRGLDLREPCVQRGEDPRGRRRQAVAERQGAQDDRHRSSPGPAGTWLVGIAGAVDHRRRPLEPLPRSHQEVRGQVAAAAR